MDAAADLTRNLSALLLGEFDDRDAPSPLEHQTSSCGTNSVATTNYNAQSRFRRIHCCPISSSRRDAHAFSAFREPGSISGISVNSACKSNLLEWQAAFHF